MSFFRKFRKCGCFLGREEREFQELLQKPVEISDVVTEKKEKAFAMLKAGESAENRRICPGKRIAAAGLKFACGAAMIVVGCIFLNQTNPVLARELPLIGGIFKELQERADIGGEYGSIIEYAVPLTEPESGDATGDDPNSGGGSGAEEDGVYTKTKNGTTITISEVYANPVTIYLSVKIKGDQPWTEVGYFAYDSAKRMELDCRFHADYGDTEKACPEEQESRSAVLDGILTEENTIEGMLILEREEHDGIPKEFTLCLELEQIIGCKSDPEDWMGGYTTAEYLALPREEREAIQAQIPEEYSDYPNQYKHVWADGPWKFEIPIRTDEREVEVVEINETNADGIGLESVMRTPQGIFLETVYPESCFPRKIQILDAEGNPKNQRFGNDKKLFFETEKTSVVDIYFLGERYYEEIYATGSNLNTYKDLTDEEKAEWREVLEEYAVYHKRVEFQGGQME